MHPRQKWALAVPGSILSSFWLLFGCLEEPKMRQSRSQEGIWKNVDFWDLFFFWLWLILGALEGAKPRSRLILFRFFSDPGSYFFCSGVIFGNFNGFWCFRNYFFMIVDQFLTLFLANAVAFSDARFCHKSPRFWQDLAKILINFFTDTSPPGGVRRTTTILFAKAKTAALH